MGHSIITVTFLSLAARLLASLDSGLFCYTATASSAVVSLLPGYLICKYYFSCPSSLSLLSYLVTSTFEIGSGNIICGSFKIVYALTFTLFLVSCLIFDQSFALLVQSLGLLLANGIGLVLGL